MSYIEQIEFLLSQGINRFRIELVYDSADDIKTLVDMYKSVIGGSKNAREA